jgi:hypothetical protein
MTDRLYRLSILSQGKTLATWERFAKDEWAARRSALDAAEREFPEAVNLEVLVHGAVWVKQA